MNAGPYIDAIIGGHTHTYMYNGTDPKSPDKPKETYPLVITQPGTGHKVLVVQAGDLSKYVGFLRIYFDQNGEPVRWEGNPIYLEHDIPKDPTVVHELKPWKIVLDKTTKEVIAKSNVPLSTSRCRYEECLIGDIITDSMVDHVRTLKSSLKFK